MPSISFASYFRGNHLTLIRPSLWRVIFVSSIPWASYFRDYHSICLSVYPFRELFLCRPSLGESYFRADYLILQSLVSYFNVYHITLHQSIPLASYFSAIHPSLGQVIFVPDHVTLQSSTPLANYFRTVQPLGQLFSCLLFDSPSFGELFPG